jgi:hypothetical protein
MIDKDWQAPENPQLQNAGFYDVPRLPTKASILLKFPSAYSQTILDLGDGTNDSINISEFTEQIPRC